MLTLNKTKAALQSCQCHYEKPKQIKHTRVNAGGQSLSTPVITGTAPLAQFGFQIRTALQYVSQEGSDFKSRPLRVTKSHTHRTAPKSGRSPNRYYENFVVLSANFSAHLQAPNGWLALRVNNFYSVVRVTKSHAHPQTTQKLGCLGCTALAHTPFPQIWGELDQRAQSPKISGDTITEIVIVGLGVTAVGHTTEKSRSFDRYPDIGYRCEENRIGQNQSYKNSGGQTPEDFQSTFMHFGYQPFGSMPFFRRASRPNSFIQFARLTLSAWASFSNCSLSSGGIRIWNAGAFPAPFGCRSRLMGVDMCVPIGVLFSLIGTHLNTVLSKKTTPRTVRAVPRRLTKPLSEVTVMAELQSTQTRPEFTWRFLALSAIGRNVIHITATTEREAREQSPAGCVMVFAGRLPVEGMVIPTPPFIHCEYRNTSTVEKTSMEVSHV